MRIIWEPRGPFPFFNAGKRYAWHDNGAEDYKALFVRVGRLVFIWDRKVSRRVGKE